MSIIQLVYARGQTLHAFVHATMAHEQFSRYTAR